MMLLSVYKINSKTHKQISEACINSISLKFLNIKIKLVIKTYAGLDIASAKISLAQPRMN